MRGMDRAAAFVTITAFPQPELRDTVSRLGDLYNAFRAGPRATFGELKHSDLPDQAQCAVGVLLEHDRMSVALAHRRGKMPKVNSGPSAGGAPSTSRATRASRKSGRNGLSVKK